MSLEKKGRGMQFKEHHPYSETQWWEYYGTGTGNFINLVLKENFKQQQTGSGLSVRLPTQR